MCVLAFNTHTQHTHSTHTHKTHTFNTRTQDSDTDKDKALNTHLYIHASVLCGYYIHTQVSCVDIVVSDKYRQVQRKRPIYSQKRTTVHKRDPDTTLSMDMWIRLYMGLFCVLWSSFANMWVSFVELVYTYPIDVSFV